MSDGCNSVASNASSYGTFTSVSDPAFSLLDPIHYPSDKAPDFLHFPQVCELKLTLSALAGTIAAILFTISPIRADEVIDAKAALSAYAGPDAKVVQMFVSGSWALGAYQVSGSRDLYYAQVLLYKPTNGSWTPLSPTTHKVMSAGGAFGSNTMVYTFNVPGLDALALGRQQSDAIAVDQNEGAFQWLTTNVSRRYCDDGTHAFGTFYYYESQRNYDGRVVPRYHSERWTITRSNAPTCNPLKAAAANQRS